MAIYVTGDFHSGYDGYKLNTTNWLTQKELTKNDYVIIAGDFGCLWEDESTKLEKYWLDWLENKNFTTLFVDGNHENFNRIKQYPTSLWNGGKIQKIRDSIFHLMRGQYFNIDGTTIWTMGGARSHDISDGVLDLNNPQDVRKYSKWKHDTTKMFRVKNISWWEQEVPSQYERDEGVLNLELNNWKVDYIITHEAPASDVLLMSNGYYKPDEYSQWLEDIRCKTDYKRFYFGHYHKDYATSYKDICLYQKIVQIA